MAEDSARPDGAFAGLVRLIESGDIEGAAIIMREHDWLRAVRICESHGVDETTASKIATEMFPWPESLGASGPTPLTAPGPGPS
jgi:hypothetical protein